MKRKFFLISSGEPDEDPPNIAQLLREAEQFALMGECRYAAVAARGALEQIMRTLCRAAGLWPTRRRRVPGTEEYQDRPAKFPDPRLCAWTLSDNGRLSHDQTWRVVKASRIGSRGAHARPCRRDSVLFMLIIAREMMAIAAKGFPPK